jgi:hypothetical protein
MWFGTNRSLLLSYAKCEFDGSGTFCSLHVVAETKNSQLLQLAKVCTIGKALCISFFVVDNRASEIVISVVTMITEPLRLLSLSLR